MKVGLSISAGKPLVVLAIGSHPDDVELGCGGTLLAHRRRGDQVAMLVMTKGERGPQGAVSRVDEQVEAARQFGVHRVFWGGFPDGAVPEGVESIDRIQAVIDDIHADVVYTHSTHDTHQDHRAAAVATVAAARHVSRVLMYEAPSSSRGFAPYFYVDIGPFLARKLEALRAHESQVRKSRLVDLEAVEAQARFRGFQSRVRYAEAFEVERFVWELSGPETQMTPAVQRNGHAHRAASERRSGARSVGADRTGALSLQERRA